jgi:hypothetical protein
VDFAIARVCTSSITLVVSGTFSFQSVEVFLFHLEIVDVWKKIEGHQKVY